MKSNSKPLFAWLSLLVFMLGAASGLSGCGGGSGGGSSSSPPQAPLITAQPSDQTVITGQSAMFSVAAIGDAPITYQWRRGGVNVDGATTASYTLALPQLVDSGSVWSVVVSNAAGSMTSAAATLTVKTGPGIRSVAGMPGGRGSIDGPVGRFYGPYGVTVDATGTVFVADTHNHTIRKVSPTGAVSTLAGIAGVIGVANGTGTAARFNFPVGIALDKAGNFVVADADNNLIRQITPLGVVTTLAGTVGSTVSVDGPVATATFSFITGIASDNTGNVFVTDKDRVRRITTAGQVSTLWTFPGSIGGPVLAGLTVDAAGVVYVLTPVGYVYKITPDGQATMVIGPDSLCRVAFLKANGISMDIAGNFYVADTPRNSIVRITPSCVATTVAGSATDAAGSIDGAGGAARFSTPRGLSLDGAGNIYVADTSNNTIRKITNDGKVTTLAGAASNSGASNGTGSVARFNNAGFFPAFRPVYFANSGVDGTSGVAYAGGVALDATGNVYVADTGNNVIRKITVDGGVTTLAGIAGVLGSLDGAAATATFAGPGGVALDAAGNVYVADSGNHKIRKISLTGIVTTLAGSDWENPLTSGGFFPSPITTGSLPVAIAVDGTGNIYVADPGVRVIRRIATSGVQTKFDFGIDSPFPRALTVDGQGNVYATTSCSIVKITADGKINALVGVQAVCGTSDGVGAAARFQDPSGLTLDALGNLYVADTGNHTIRKVTPAGVVTTIAGQAGVSGVVLGNFPGTLNQPVGMAIDANGLLYTTSENTVLRIQLQ